MWFILNHSRVVFGLSHIESLFRRWVYPAQFCLDSASLRFTWFFVVFYAEAQRTQR